MDAGGDCAAPRIVRRRAREPFLSEPTPQEWVPLWVDIVLELWVGSVDRDSAAGTVQRNIVLEALMRSSSNAAAVEGVFVRHGLRGAREYLRVVTVGPPPQLVEEFEAELRGLVRG